MSLQIGQQLGSYEIRALLGKGGMGEVYRAGDLKLKREVAIKILPGEFSLDADRATRFQREAEVLAALNHPNIAAIYDLQRADDIRFLVLELVEGETLADRLQRGPIPVEEALNIAKHICEALEAAHEKGIVHRDLKPANVKVTPDGNVKVLDFGLAKALENIPALGSADSPTMLSGAVTNPGIILGTAGYMSPEQARGHIADQRSDIFSFACVLYEMLTGRRTFQGETVTDIIASVVAQDPDWRAIPANLHPRTEELIRRCLVKNRKDRWHAIADVRVELEAIMADPHGLKLQAAREIPQRPLWRRAIPFAITAVLVGGIAVAATVAVTNMRPSPPAEITRFPFVLPEGQRLTPIGNFLAMSPDGANIVYAANEQLYLRSMGDMEARPIQGTSQSAANPFFSPDGKWVAYLSRTESKLKRIAISGGSAVNICDTDGNIFGPTWNSDDYIYFGQANAIMRVTGIGGGKPETVITLNDDETAHRPQLLPGGDALLFTLLGNTASSRWDNAQVVVQSLKSPKRKVMVSGGSDARYVPTGHIVYALGTTVFAVPFDVRKLQTGGAVPIIEGVMRVFGVGGGGANTQFAFSNNGSLVYIRGDQTTANETTLVLVDRSGARKPLNILSGLYASPRISPDGTKLTVNTDDGKDRSVWIYDLNDASPIRKLTFEGQNGSPLWTPDSKRVVFASDREGDEAIFWQRVDGGAAERLTKVDKGIRPQLESWSPDGKTLVFSNRRLAGGSAGVSMLSVGADQEPKLVIKPPAQNVSLSPDGRWLAYMFGGNEVHVQPFPPTGEVHQITANGRNPLWSPDRKQLFFLKGSGGTGQIMAVDISTQKGFVVGKTAPLPIEGIIATGPRPYDVTPDGKSFVVIVPKSQAGPEKAPPVQINVTLNWFEELKQRVPVQ